MSYDDLISEGAARAFADVLGGGDTLSRVRQAVAAEQAASRSAAEDAVATVRAEDEPATPEELRAILRERRGTLWLTSHRTGHRLGFLLGTPKTRDDGRRVFVSLVDSDGSRPTWLGTVFLTANAYRGRMWPARWSHSRRSEVDAFSPAGRCADWLFTRLVRGTDDDIRKLLEQADVTHQETDQ